MFKFLKDFYRWFDPSYHDPHYFHMNLTPIEAKKEFSKKQEKGVRTFYARFANGKEITKPITNSKNENEKSNN